MCTRYENSLIQSEEWGFTIEDLTISGSRECTQDLSTNMGLIGKIRLSLLSIFSIHAFPFLF